MTTARPTPTVAGAAYELLLGDALTVLKTLPANSVQTCITSPPYFGLRAYLHNGHDDKHLEIGTEETPDAYVANLVAVFREVRRVLRDDATCWINLGDSYGGPKGNTAMTGGKSDPERGNRMYGDIGKKAYGMSKQLLGMPWRVAFALQADGWILRSEIIWAKKAPMPESVTDRPTKSHEQVFLLAKSANYFYDHVAIAESAVGNDPGNLTHKHQNGAGIVLGRKTDVNGGLMNVGAATTRNKRSVWTLGPESFSGSHYATMPTKLVEPCILAGSSQYGACSKCLAPYERVVEREATLEAGRRQPGYGQKIDADGFTTNGHGGSTLHHDVTKKTTGWQPTCICNADPVPCVVLDPFFGSGTVAAVALKHGRRFVGIDLDSRNIDLARKRIEESQPLLAGFSL